MIWCLSPICLKPTKNTYWWDEFSDWGFHLAVQHDVQWTWWFLAMKIRQCFCCPPWAFCDGEVWQSEGPQMTEVGLSLYQVEHVYLQRVCLALGVGSNQSGPNPGRWRVVAVLVLLLLMMMAVLVLLAILCLFQTYFWALAVKGLWLKFSPTERCFLYTLLLTRSPVRRKCNVLYCLPWPDCPGNQGSSTNVQWTDS